MAIVRKDETSGQISICTRVPKCTVDAGIRQTCRCIGVGNTGLRYENVLLSGEVLRWLSTGDVYACTCDLFWPAVPSAVEEAV